MYKRIIQESDQEHDCSKECLLKFFLTPVEILPASENNSSVASVRLKTNVLDDYVSENARIQHTLDVPLEEIKCGIVIRSIGYRSTPIDDSLPFDERRGVIRNTDGRVEDNVGLYCSGWAAFGATGVILNTMSASFEVGKNILSDIAAGRLDSASHDKLGYETIGPLLNTRNANVVDWVDWTLVDSFERERGLKEGKPREKIVRVDEILTIKERGDHQ